METRLANLLRIIVEEYIATAQPVGSQSLVERYRLDISPATVRNWFAELEDLGCCMQPHTSGGRIPTEHGFQTYIELFIRPKTPARRDRETLEQAAMAPDEEGRRAKNVAKALAELSGSAAVMGWRHADTYYTGLSQLFAQPEFKDWQRVINLTEILDHLDDALNTLRKTRFNQPRILIGKECPFGPACGAVIASTDDALIGLLGPMRMDYQRALSLMTTALEILS